MPLLLLPLLFLLTCSCGDCSSVAWWTPSRADVPLPAAAALLAGGMACARRSRHRRRHRLAQLPGPASHPLCLDRPHHPHRPRPRPLLSPTGSPISQDSSLQISTSGVCFGSVLDTLCNRLLLLFAGVINSQPRSCLAFFIIISRSLPCCTSQADGHADHRRHHSPHHHHLQATLLEDD